jgi:cytochrome c553
MYSAYDGVHMFQVPAVVNGLDPSQVEIDWSASDPSMVALEPDTATGGVMITTQKAGTVSIIATAGSLCGASLLTITAATPDDWTAGSERYNMGVTITRLPNGMMRQRDAGADAGTTIAAACTSCHGDTASTGPYKTVQHTPEQTGGFSDADLVNIFEHGMVPTGGYFDTSIVSYAMWQSFHKWDVGDSEKGVIVYLRSLAPAAQTGAANFGGRFDGGMGGGRDGGVRDGGMREGGGMMREAGGQD